MAFATDKEVVEQAAVLQEEPVAFPAPDRAAALNAAHGKVCAILGTHFIVTGTITPSSELKQLEARLAALYLIERKYNVRNVSVPEIVVRWHKDVLQDLKNAKLNPNSQHALELGLTPKTVASADALARGVMTEKRGSLDRGDIEDAWEPADDGTSDSDAPLGDQSIWT